MASISETGHAKNVANLYKYNQFLEGLGTKYSPSLAEISLSSMQALYTDAQAKMDDLKTLTDVWKKETNEREIAFSTLATFCGRLVGMMRGTNASEQMMDDLTALVGKQRSAGRRTATPKEPPVDAPETDATVEAEPTRSRSQLSFDLRIENYSKVVVLLKGFTGYAPTEPELSIAALETLYADLVTLNHRATKADFDLRGARAQRNTVLYGKGTGVIDRVKKSKGYVLGVFGKSSADYKTAVSIKFSDLVR